MSMPSIPNLTPEISVTRENALNVILSSIGMEELSMAHILNSEAEKIQFALGTLTDSNGNPLNPTTSGISSTALQELANTTDIVGMQLSDVLSAVS